MEVVMDRLVEELDALAELDYADGGFRDQIDLAQSTWFGDPGVLADQQYPAAYVAPVNITPGDDNRGSTSQTYRNLTIEIGVLTDPRGLFDEVEVVEQTASRELIRTGSVIERMLERISLQMPGGLGERSRKVLVTETRFPPQERGAILLASVVLTVVVQKAYDLPK